jgi:hypothetical protein
MVVLVLLAIPSAATAQASADSQERADGIAIGVVLTPALEGSGPWLMPGVRVSIPLGSRTGLDVEGGRIFGGVNAYGAIRTFGAVQVRRQRGEPRAQAAERYWKFGLHYFPEDDFTPEGGPAGRVHHTAALLGLGWSHLVTSASRLDAEIGFSGGDGIMCFATVALKWRVRR